MRQLLDIDARRWPILHVLMAGAEWHSCSGRGLLELPAVPIAAAAAARSQSTTTLATALLR